MSCGSRLIRSSCASLLCRWWVLSERSWPAGWGRCGPHLAGVWRRRERLTGSQSGILVGGRWPRLGTGCGIFPLGVLAGS
eukprot:5423924-Heterocapsa_arctica.AAC.1